MRTTHHSQRHSQHNSQRGKALLWILLGLTLALGTGLLLLLFARMDDPAEQATGGEPEPQEGIAEPPEGPGPLPPRRLGNPAQPGPGGMHKIAARHRAFLKTVKRDAAPAPWDEAEGDGPKAPVTVAVASSGKQLHPDVLIATRELSPKIASCYRRRLRAKPDLEGKIFVSFTLRPKDEYSAAVGKSRIAASKVKDLPLETCVLQALSTFSVVSQLASETAWNHVTFAVGRGANRVLFKPQHEPPPKPGQTPPPAEPPPGPGPATPPGQPPAEPPPEPPPEPQPQPQP